MELDVLINHKTARGKAAFGIIEHCKTSKYLDGNCKMAWDRMIANYVPKMTLSMLQLEKEFEISKFENVEKDLEDWVSDLERPIGNFE